MIQYGNDLRETQREMSKNLFKCRRAPNFPKGREIDLQIHKVQQILNWLNLKEDTP